MSKRDNIDAEEHSSEDIHFIRQPLLSDMPDVVFRTFQNGDYLIGRPSISYDTLGWCLKQRGLYKYSTFATHKNKKTLTHGGYAIIDIEGDHLYYAGIRIYTNTEYYKEKYKYTDDGYKNPILPMHWNSVFSTFATRFDGTHLYFGYVAHGVYKDIKYDSPNTDRILTDEFSQTPGASKKDVTTLLEIDRELSKIRNKINPETAHFEHDDHSWKFKNHSSEESVLELVKNYLLSHRFPEYISLLNRLNNCEELIAILDVPVDVKAGSLNGFSGHYYLTSKLSHSYIRPD